MPAAYFSPRERCEWHDSCPYCGAGLTLLLDPEDVGSDYIEDCQVCCCPMVVVASLDADGEPRLSLRREDQ